MKTGLEDKSGGELDGLVFRGKAMMDALVQSKWDIAERMQWWMAARSLCWLVAVERDRRAISHGVRRV